MGMNLRNSLNNGLNTGLRQSISGGVDGLGFFKTASLDLQFASNKTLNDRVSDSNLITFTRTSTATYVDGNGVIQSATTNTPRFDHDPATGESLGLLIEESRTNLIQQSEDITSGYGGTTVWTITSNAASAPDGTSTADQCLIPAATAQHSFYWGSPITSTTTTQSLFVKGIGEQYAGLGFWHTNADWAVATFDLSGAGSVTGYQSGSSSGFTSLNAGIEAYSNGWYRIHFTSTQSNRASLLMAFGAASSGTPTLDANSGVEVTTGDGTTGYLIWGVQVEEGSFPTSYIPTSGSTVTRAADVAEITGTNFSSWYNQSAGTWFAEASARGKLCNHSVSTSASSYQNSTQFFGSNIETDGFYRVRTDSSLMTSNFPGLTSIVPMQKYAGTYNSQSIQSAFQGTASTSVAVSGTFISGLAHMYIGRIHSGGPFRSHIKRLSYFSTRLDDATLESITS